jgi:hypothetical protein
MDYFRNFELNMFNSSVIVVGFSLVLIAMDEYVVKAWREKHWQKLAASGDVEKAELLKLAMSAKVVEE